MKLAVRKELGSVPGGGYHYMLMPKKMDHDNEHLLWEMTGHIIIDVPDPEGEQLLKDAGAALLHQVRVAFIAEKALAAKANGVQ